jgi:hypothetical protein
VRAPIVARRSLGCRAANTAPHVPDPDEGRSSSGSVSPRAGVTAGRTSGSASRSRTAASPGGPTLCVRYQPRCASSRLSRCSAPSSTVLGGDHRSTSAGSTGSSWARERPRRAPSRPNVGTRIGSRLRSNADRVLHEAARNRARPRARLPRSEGRRFRRVPLETQTPRDAARRPAARSARRSRAPAIRSGGSRATRALLRP